MCVNHDIKSILWTFLICTFECSVPFLNIFPQISQDFDLSLRFEMGFDGFLFKYFARAENNKIENKMNE